MLRLILAISMIPGVVRAQLDYPEAPPGNVVDDYFGTPVADPYRWLEDVDSDATLEWIEAQNALWEEFMAEVPVRDSMSRAAGGAVVLRALLHAPTQGREVLLLPQ